MDASPQAASTGPSVPGWPTITVVVPCFNAERYIAATVRSALSQDWPAVEVVVVDDGSTDCSADIVERQFPQVRLVRQPNRGVAAARNAGIACGRGEWIAFLDADDLWLPGKLSAQMRAIEADGQARMCYSSWQNWTSTTPEPGADYLAALQAQADDSARWWGVAGWIYPELLVDCEVWTSTVLVHRSVLDEVGCFDASMRMGEDWDLWLRASRVTKILRVLRPLALYRRHPDSITCTVPERNFPGELITRAVQRFGYTGPDGRAASRRAVDRFLAKTWVDLADRCLMAGQRARARQSAWASLRIWPWQGAAWKVLAKSWLLTPPRPSV